MNRSRGWTWLLVLGPCAAGFVLGWLCRPEGVALESEPTGRLADEPLVHEPRFDPRGPGAESRAAPELSDRWEAGAPVPTGLGSPLAPLGTADVQELVRRLRTTTDPAEAVWLARKLVLQGGGLGLSAVAEMSAGDHRGVEFRLIGVEALALAPADLRPEAANAVAKLFSTDLPSALEVPVALAYADLLGPGAVPALLRAVEAGDLGAHVVFGAIRPILQPGHLPALVELLPNTHGVDAQQELLRSIGYAAGAKRTPMLLEWLRSPPSGARREALGWALNQFAGEHDLPQLWSALGDEPNWEAQGQIARAIARVGGEEALAEIRERARDPQGGVSMDALAHALEATASRENLPRMAEALTEMSGWDAADRLAKAIARTGGTDGLDLMLGLLERDGGQVHRAAIVRAVRAFSDARSSERLSHLFHAETDPVVAAQLATTILQLDPARGREELLPRLVAEGDPVRRAAIADVLERNGGPEALPALEDALRVETDGRATWQMARAIAVRGRAGLSALSRLLAEASAPRQRLAILGGAIAVDGSNASVLAPPLLRTDPDPKVRQEAARVLGRSRSPGVEEHLRKALELERQPEVRRAIEAALQARSK